MKTFLKKSDLTLENGGYLTSKGEKGKAGKAVANAEFNKAQKHAEYVVTLAKLAEGKDFKGKKADSMDDLKALVAKQLSSSDVVKHVKAPSAPKRPTTEALKDEALAFITFQEEGSNAEKVNAFLQQFNIINEFEEFGLFFDEGISKLNKIYTMKDVVKAVTSMIDNLD